MAILTDPNHAPGGPGRPTWRSRAISRPVRKRCTRLPISIHGTWYYMHGLAGRWVSPAGLVQWPFRALRWSLRITIETGPEPHGLPGSAAAPHCGAVHDYPEPPYGWVHMVGVYGWHMGAYTWVGTWVHIRWCYCLYWPYWPYWPYWTSAATSASPERRREPTTNDRGEAAAWPVEGLAMLRFSLAALEPSPCGERSTGGRSERPPVRCS